MPDPTPLPVLNLLDLAAGHPLYVAGLLYGGAQDLVGLDPSGD